jgi:hypothetical protein
MRGCTDGSSLPDVQGIDFEKDCSDSNVSRGFGRSFVSSWNFLIAIPSNTLVHSHWAFPDAGFSLNIGNYDKPFILTVSKIRAGSYSQRLCRIRFPRPDKPVAMTKLSSWSQIIEGDPTHCIPRCGPMRLLKQGAAFWVERLGYDLRGRHPWFDDHAHMLMRAEEQTNISWSTEKFPFHTTESA